jgi:hypothetical protein
MRFCSQKRRYFKILLFDIIHAELAALIVIPIKSSTSPVRTLR